MGPEVATITSPLEIVPLTKTGEGLEDITMISPLEAVWLSIMGLVTEASAVTELTRDGDEIEDSMTTLPFEAVEVTGTGIRLEKPRFAPLDVGDAIWLN